MGNIGKISVIVPVYKAEASLSRCVDSILAQTYQDLEVILVDDGSPDISGMICDGYMEKDRRVQVVHQTNAGVAAARNTGLKNASGEWVAFVDSDDWVQPNYIWKLARCAEKVSFGLVTGQLSKADGSGLNMRDFPRTILSKEELLMNFWTLMDAGLLNSVCGKLFCREKIETPFFEEMRCGEDLRFSLDYLKGAEYIFVTDTVGYCCADDAGELVGTTRHRNRNVREFSLYISGVLGLLEFDRMTSAQSNRLQYDAFVFRSMCGDVKWIACSSQFKEAKREISRYLDVYDVQQALKHRAWHELGLEFKLVGWLLLYRQISVAVLGCRLGGILSKGLRSALYLKKNGVQGLIRRLRGAR